MKAKKAKALYVKARFYQLFGFLFACLGLGLFIYLYFYESDGSYLNILTDPFTIGILLVPFIPALILSRIAYKASKDLEKLLDED